MPTREQVIEELHFVTELLSTRTRTLAGGVLALSWVFLLANATGGEEAGLVSSATLVPPIILALISLLADLGQYWSGYVATRQHFRRMERQELAAAEYDYGSISYRLRTVFFYLKQAFMLVSVFWLLLVLLWMI